MSQKFTVVDIDGEPVARHLTAAEAAHIILTDDGREYEIREDDGGYELWSRQQVANRPWEATVIFTVADTLAEAEAEIFAAVIRASWPRHPEAMTDEQFDAIAAEA
jgi:hypothetical protein